ncbi:hypothetical protein BRADI_1g43343v3 [Brachypodium distachyon]|uniref:Uncharacterized protein n=1 Tax=Brachypodium distachyon TaxID=15368 RepID=A0A2K2DP49_BRADI|nr:hypothetical protein BRADI_1g43343v3 [Brachypodium distachyon]
MSRRASCSVVISPRSTSTDKMIDTMPESDVRTATVAPRWPRPLPRGQDGRRRETRPRPGTSAWKMRRSGRTTCEGSVTSAIVTRTVTHGSRLWSFPG